MGKKGRRKDPKLPKLPKQIAGVKLGKDLRRAMAPVLLWSRNPLVSDTIAAALVAGAAALTESKGAKGAAKAAGLSAGAAAAVNSAQGPSRIGVGLAVALGEIAVRLLVSYAGRQGSATRVAARERPAQADPQMR